MNLEQQLKSFGKIDPPSRFVEGARGRLIHRIEADDAWFVRIVKRIKTGMMNHAPTLFFVVMARQRLLARMAAGGDVMNHVSTGWLRWMQRAVASALVMLLIVIPTLFFVDGGHYVSASQDSVLHVTRGQVLVQRAGSDEWQSINSTLLLKSGDTLQLNSDSDATLALFDDSQVRLTDRATVIVHKLDPLARTGAGMTELSLMAGRAWVQTLNVPDGYKSLSVRTPDASVSADYATFDIAVDPTGSTTVRVFKQHSLVAVLNEKTGALLSQTRVSADRQVRVDAGSRSDVMAVSEPDAWVRSNTEQDQQYLIALQARDLELREKTAGVLPGHFLYPVKQAEESLMKALAFTENSQKEFQFVLANKRLNEAIVLLNQRQYEKAQEALMAYQSIARQIAKDVAGDQSLRTQIQNELITRNYKTLVASLPTADINLVREAIDETQAMIAADPLEREEVRLQNMTQGLAQLPDFVGVGNLVSAKEILVNYQTMESQLLSEANSVSDPLQRQAALDRILGLRTDALVAMESLEHTFVLDDLQDPNFIALLNSVSQSTQREINKVQSLMEPLLPPEIRVAAFDPVDQRVADFVASVEVYRTWHAQKNQVNVLLNRMGREAKDIEFLAKIRSELTSPFARDIINAKIIDLKQKARLNKHKAVERKIEQAKARVGE